MNQHVNKKNPKELTFLPGILELTFLVATFKVNN